MVTEKSRPGLIGEDAELLGAGHVAVHRRRLEQLLGRDATPVQAGAADLLLLDHGDVETGRRAVQSGRVAARSPADDHDVVVVGGHRAATLPGGYVGQSMSTRRLILAALLCGLAILVAFAVQVIVAG